MFRPRPPQETTQETISLYKDICAAIRNTAFLLKIPTWNIQLSELKTAITTLEKVSKGNLIKIDPLFKTATRNALFAIQELIAKAQEKPPSIPTQELSEIINHMANTIKYLDDKLKAASLPSADPEKKECNSKRRRTMTS